MTRFSVRSVILLIAIVVILGLFILLSTIISVTVQQNNQLLDRLQLMELEQSNQMSILQNDIKFESRLVRLDVTEGIIGIGSRLDSVENGLSARITTTKRHIQSDIVKIDTVYSSLLDEQKKRTVDDVYLDETTTNRVAEGVALYRQGNYSEAYKTLQSVSAQTTDNHEAVFCMIASLYEINPLDSSKYPEIRRSLRELVSKGYWNERIDTILSQIDMETKTTMPVEKMN